MFKKLSIIVGMIIAAFALKATITNHPSKEIKPPKNSEFPEILNIKKSDIVFGNENSKVIVIEYSTLTCPGCAAFHNDVFYKIKSDFIDTGKILYVFRDLAYDKQAFKASILLRCRNELQDKFMDALFKLQDSWAFKKDYEEQLTKIGQVGGIKPEEYISCINNKEIEKSIFQNLYDAKALEIQATPTIFINGKYFDGILNYNNIKDQIIKELK